MIEIPSNRKNILVDVRVFPLNIHFLNNQEIRNNQNNEFNIVKGQLSTFIFNDVIYFESNISPEQKEKSPHTKNISSHHSQYIQPLIFNLRALEVGVVVLHSFYEVTRDHSIFDADLIQEIDSQIFSCSNHDSLLVKEFSDSLVRLGVAAHSSVMKYDLLIDVPDEQFKKEMAWRAWSSLQCISFDNDVDQTPWPSLSGLRDDELIFCNGSIKVIAENLFGWWTPNSSQSVPSILRQLEPISYMVAKQSIVAGAVNNLKQVTQQFVLESEALLNPEDIRKYDALVRHNIIKVDEYKSSTEKLGRSIFRWACERNEISQSLDDLKAAHEPVAIAIENMDREADQRVARRISAVILIFTSMTFLSVVADVVGLLDHRNQIFLFEERFTIFGGALALTVVAVVVVMASFFKKRN